VCHFALAHPPEPAQPTQTSSATAPILIVVKVRRLGRSRSIFVSKIRRPPSKMAEFRSTHRTNVTDGNDDPHRHSIQTSAASVAMRNVGDNLRSEKRNHRHMPSREVAGRLARRDVVTRISIPACSRLIQRKTCGWRMAQGQESSSATTRTRVMKARMQVFQCSSHASGRHERQVGIGPIIGTLQRQAAPNANRPRETGANKHQTRFQAGW